ncbi:MAG: ABC transporter substrate-binding protein [Thermoleophilaceae bacterium]
MRGRWFVALVACATLVVAGCGGDDDDEGGGNGGGSDSSGNVPGLTVAVATTQSDILNYVAEAQGFFEEENVDVTIRDNTQANTTSMVVSGQVDIAAFAAVAPLIASGQGRPASTIYGISGGGVGGFAIGKDVESLEDLRNVDDCRIGTFPAGTSSYGYGTLYNEKFELGCEVVPLQDAASEVAALASDRVDAVVGGYAFLAPAVEEQDANVLVDTREPEQRARYIGEDFPEVVFWGLRDNLEEKRDSLGRYMAALDKARQFIEEQSDEQVAAILSDLEVFSSLSEDEIVPTVVEPFRIYMGAGSQDGYISEEAWEVGLERYELFGVPDFDASAEENQYDQAVNMEYYEEGIGAPSGE